MKITTNACLLPCSLKPGSNVKVYKVERKVYNCTSFQQQRTILSQDDTVLLCCRSYILFFCGSGTWWERSVLLSHERRGHQKIKYHQIWDVALGNDLGGEKLDERGDHGVGLGFRRRGRGWPSRVEGAARQYETLGPVITSSYTCHERADETSLYKRNFKILFSVKREIPFKDELLWLNSYSDKRVCQTFLLLFGAWYQVSVHLDDSLY